jgi:hypothetical protein
MQIIYINIIKISRDQTPHVHLRRTRLKSATPNVSTTCCLQIWPCRRKINSSQNFLICLLPALFTCSFFYPCLAPPSVLPTILSFYPTVCLLFLVLFFFFHSPIFFHFTPHFPYIIIPLLIFFSSSLYFTFLLFILLLLPLLSSSFLPHLLSFCSSPTVFILIKHNEKLLHRSSERRAAH